MDTLVDDVGSFPLPAHIERKLFLRAYDIATEAIAEEKNPAENEFVTSNFYKPVLQSFRKKCEAGLDVVNYPQHYDIREQFTKPIRRAMEKGTYVVEEKDAVIPEVRAIEAEAKNLCEETGRRAALRVCVTGPLELYLREVGTTPYEDVLMMFAETVKRFAKNSLLNSKYVKTEVVSLDEPSFGFQEISTTKETTRKVLEKAFDFNGAVKQVHLHSSTKVAEMLSVGNLDMLSFEFAASPKNIESISKRMLEEADKQIRVGVSRTDIDAITAELYEGGVTKPSAEQLVESEETIRKRFETAKRKYGERMTFTGPDCGLGGWPTQEAAQLLLKRTVSAVKSARTNV